MMLVWHRLRGRAQLFNPVWHFGISEPVNHKCTHKSLQSRESDVFVGLQWSRRDFSDGLGIFEIDRLTIRIRKFSDAPFTLFPFHPDFSGSPALLRSNHRQH